MHVQSNGGWLGGWLGGRLGGWLAGRPKTPPPPAGWRSSFAGWGSCTSLCMPYPLVRVVAIVYMGVFLSVYCLGMAI